MKCVSLILVITALFSCATHKAERRVSVPEGEPLWLYSAQEFCKSDQICSSAEGANISESDSRAQKSLASIFEMRIKGEFKFSKHSFSGEEQTEMEEYVEDNINKKVDSVLKGVEIIERFKKDGLHFSLAALDKSKTVKILRNEIKDLDSKLNYFYEQKSRLFVKKLNILYNERKLLNEKLIVVNETGIPTSITYKKINDIKFSDIGSSKLKLQMGEAVPESLQKKIAEIFTSVGYKVIEKKEEYKIKVKFSEFEEFLNVRGFKKYTFELNLAAMTPNDKKVGSFVISLVSNGRSKDDAFLKIKPKLINRLESNIDKLNLK